MVGRSPCSQQELGHLQNTIWANSVGVIAFASHLLACERSPVQFRICPVEAGNKSQSSGCGVAGIFSPIVAVQSNWDLQVYTLNTYIRNSRSRRSPLPTSLYPPNETDEISSPVGQPAHRMFIALPRKGSTESVGKCRETPITAYDI